MPLFKSASTVSLFTLASRLTGLVRDVLMASFFGVSALTDAFHVAFRIPNLFRRMFGEGALSQAFGGKLGSGLNTVRLAKLDLIKSTTYNSFRA